MKYRPVELEPGVVVWRLAPTLKGRSSRQLRQQFAQLARKRCLKRDSETQVETRKRAS
jgi:hypothetical protein